MSLYVVASRPTGTNARLVSAFRRLGVNAAFLLPAQARERARADDVVLGRVDVLPALDGVQHGLSDLRQLETSGVRVLNRAGALLTAHDKLATALRLGRAGLPHPRTVHLDSGREPALTPPVVVKPRFGSWGRDVVLCRTQRELSLTLRRLRRYGWFRRHGALLQELVPPAGRDLRLVVAGGQMVGAIARQGPAGEWRTNVSLGGSRHPADPPPVACELAVAAAEAIGSDLVGVDLLPGGEGDYVVLELNGAVDFTVEYSLDGRDVFAEAAASLIRLARPAEVA